jgi:hypothetical protein
MLKIERTMMIWEDLCSSNPSFLYVSGVAVIAAGGLGLSTTLFCEDVEISQRMGLSYGFLMAICEKLPEIVGKKDAPSTGPDYCRLQK